MTTITARNKKGTEIVIEYDLPEAGDLSGLQEKFGDDVTARHARSSMVVALQGFIRSQSNGGATAKEVQTACDAWLPSTRQPGKSKVEKTMALYEQLSDEERADLLKVLQAA